MSGVKQEPLTIYGTRADTGIDCMRKLVSETAGDAPVIIGLNGSYARREVTTGSDVDLILLTRDNFALEDAAKILRNIQERLNEDGFKLAASGGVFDEVTRAEDLHAVIGGQDDDNINITRRLLLLLEGEWLHDQNEFNGLRSAVIERYVNDNMRKEQIALFLLNDIIRYWRTICVDYEHKIGSGKASEIRLLKLRFSRMLLYIGGVVAVGETYDKSPSEKRRVLMDLLAMPPAKRVARVMGNKANAALEIYAEFLEALDDESIRAELSKLRERGKYSDCYRAQREKAGAFRRELKSALEATFPAPHPLLSALML